MRKTILMEVLTLAVVVTILALLPLVMGIDQGFTVWQLVAFAALWAAIRGFMLWRGQRQRRHALH